MLIFKCHGSHGTTRTTVMLFGQPKLSFTLLVRRQSCSKQHCSDYGAALGQNYQVMLFKTLTKDTWSVTSNSACFRAVRWRRIFQRLPKVAVWWQQGRNPLRFNCRHTLGREHTRLNTGWLPRATPRSQSPRYSARSHLISSDLLVSHSSSQLVNVLLFREQQQAATADSAGAEQLFQPLNSAPAYSARQRINQANVSPEPDLENIRIQSPAGTTSPGGERSLTAARETLCYGTSEFLTQPAEQAGLQQSHLSYTAL